MKIRLDNLVAHPFRCSHHSQVVRDKVRRHIESTGFYPPIVVRKVRGSKYQIIDGHLRCEILKELGYSSVKAVNLGRISDSRANILLLTLNHLRSHDDPKKRAELLKRYMDKDSVTLEKVSNLLPGSKRTHQRLIELSENKPAILRPENLPEMPKPFAVYLTGVQKEMLDKALKLAKKGSSSHSNADAIQVLAERFMEESNRKDAEDAKNTDLPTKHTKKDEKRDRVNTERK